MYVTLCYNICQGYVDYVDWVDVACGHVECGLRYVDQVEYSICGLCCQVLTKKIIEINCIKFISII